MTDHSDVIERQSAQARMINLGGRTPSVPAPLPKIDPPQPDEYSRMDRIDGLGDLIKLEPRPWNGASDSCLGHRAASYLRAVAAVIQ